LSARSYRSWMTLPQQPQKRSFGILSLRGSLRQVWLSIVWDCSPSWLNRWEEPGDDILSPLLQVTYQVTLAFFPSLTWQSRWLPLSIKLFYLTPSTCSAWILPFETQGPRSFENVDFQYNHLTFTHPVALIIHYFSYFTKSHGTQDVQ
jgi:hypothetical protein